MGGGVTALHPSQRRVSCQACRKQKARCQRYKQDDPKCSRCTLLNLECTTGQQRNIGRPRRTAASITPLAVEKPPTTMCTQTVPVPVQETVDWTNLVSPATTPIQNTAVADIDSFGGAWPAAAMDSFGQSPQPWDAFLGFADAEFMFTHHSTFAPPFLLAPSPPSTPSSDHGNCLNEIHNVEIPGPDKSDAIDVSAALVELSKINIDLHARITAAEAHRDNLEFDNVVRKESPLCIDGIMLAEFVLKISLELLQIVNSLLSNRQTLASPVPLGSRRTKSPLQNPSQPNTYSCPSPVALLITSAFTQLITLYDLILGCITTRVERLADPIPSIPGIMFNNLPLDNSYAQGMLFCQAIVYMLERTETALGTKSEMGGGQVGLLSARQIKMLWGELDNRHPIISGHATMRPSTLRRLFGKVGGIFRQMVGDSLYS